MKSSFARSRRSFSKQLVAWPVAALSLAAAFAAEPPVGSYVNTPFIITNNQTQYNVSSDSSTNEVWVTFAGTFTNTGADQYIGSQTLDQWSIDYGTSVFQSFKLTDLSGVAQGGVYESGTLQPGTSAVPYLGNTPQYTFSLNGFSGRVYVNYGSTALTAAPPPGNPGTSPYIVFEPTVLGQTQSGIPTVSNVDLSYVDGVSAPASFAFRNATTGALINATSGQFQFNPGSTTVGSSKGLSTANSAILANVAAAVQTLAPNAVVTNGSNEVVRVMSSAASPSSYHDWVGLMTTLQTSGKELNVNSYTAGSTADPYNLSNTYYGYSGAAAVSGQPPGWENNQTYTSTTQFVANMSTNLSEDQKTALQASFTEKGFGSITGPGAIITGSGGSSGPFTIFIPQAILNASTGIYGNNPGYIVQIGNTTYTYASNGIQNDLGGRVVGDLVAGMVFGWSNSNVNITDHATATGTNFYGSTFSALTLGELSTGEYFYLLSMAAAQGKLSDWIGSSADINPENYDIYLAAISANTDAYASGFTDRLQGPASPDIFWYTANAPANPYEAGENFENIGYIEFTLENFSSIPEPSTWALLGLGGVALYLSHRRRARQA